jgi:hypothetical protein
MVFGREGLMKEYIFLTPFQKLDRIGHGLMITIPSGWGGMSGLSSRRLGRPDFRLGNRKSVGFPDRRSSPLWWSSCRRIGRKMPRTVISSGKNNDLFEFAR